MKIEVSEEQVWALAPKARIAAIPLRDGVSVAVQVEGGGGAVSMTIAEFDAWSRAARRMLGLPNAPGDA